MITILAAASTVTTTPTTTPRAGVDFTAIVGMFGGLIFVLLLIFLLAYAVKRLNLVTGNNAAIKVKAQSALGPKERVVLIELDGQQYLLGVTSQQVTLLDKYDSPVNIETTSFSQKLKQVRAQQQ
ncbi:flagellar biosynthetic protein FliO [Shewanella avicenniae]|uniref:Flagellar protein n=1 Tax=Shewanella avicenniae TaxID=2814294 RepID=A0ABX7QPC4_9GAMM|nr:flagellar biosynthetic protein FliO [Shewanella avicenniae]QSX32715.1 flagellar biosynthetic protein FliO [Shewanella avicenniae]